jgi:hypothetical protein
MREKTQNTVRMMRPRMQTPPDLSIHTIAPMGASDKGAFGAASALFSHHAALAGFSPCGQLLAVMTMKRARTSSA